MKINDSLDRLRSNSLALLYFIQLIETMKTEDEAILRREFLQTRKGFEWHSTWKMMKFA